MKDPLSLIVREGDCLDLMRASAPDSFDAIVCDPPYELGFMGRVWDASGIAFRPETWREALRVAKPGAHLLAFGGTRTFHRIAVAIEDAGWEIRDTLSWLHGQGFPKSLDVAAAIEKRRDDEAEIRVVCRFLRAAIEAHPTATVRTIADAFGFHPRMVEHWAARDSDSQPTLPTLDQWASLRKLLGFGSDVDALVNALNVRKGEFGETWHDREITGVHKPDQAPAATFAVTGRDKLRRDIPASPEGVKWTGWGTALKPAWEPIILARKPLAGTVAENVLAHGVGGLNIDATRIPGEPVMTSRNVALGSSSGGVFGAADKPAEFASHALGRFPANLVLDGEAAAMLDDASGKRLGGGDAVDGDGRPIGDVWEVPPVSRFYYVAKANRTERDAGLEALPARRGSSETFDPNVRDGVGDLRTPEVKNIHPTVKPIALMRWLCRLVTPKGGTILDPFAGSGTTGCAAALEGFHFVGFDMVPEHVEIARLRIAHWRRVAIDAPFDLFDGYNA